MCNAYNHSFDCDCGFGGDTGGGGGRRGGHRHLSLTEVLERPISAGWVKDSRGTIESYVNPNAHCPVCGAAVYFYRSPYDGRVFFDELGWPWPKHPCTDNYREPHRATRQSVSSGTPRIEPAWRGEGWHPLLSSKVYSGGDRLEITGDLQNEFAELYLPQSEAAEPDSPIFIRGLPEPPDVFEVTFLHSNHFNTRDRIAIAFRRRIMPVGDETIIKVADGDPKANNIVGQFVLWELDDPVAAKPYLECAAAAGIFDALIALTIIALFRMRPDAIRHHPASSAVAGRPVKQ